MNEIARGATDAELVLVARSGERSAFAELVTRYRPMLTTVCRKYFSDTSGVDDIVQEAILQAMLSLGSLRQPERFGAWLCGIGLNIARRWQRESFGTVALDLEDVESADTAPGPENVAGRRELSRRVRRAVDALPRAQRAAVTGFYLAGLSQLEVAASLGVSVGTVKAQLHEARRTLRLRLSSFVEEETMNAPTIQHPVPMRIVDIRRAEIDPRRPALHLAILNEEEGDRALTVWVSPDQGLKLAMLLEKAGPTRPAGAELAISLISALGGRIREVRLTKLETTIYYAIIEVDGPAGRVELDARPGDALELALLADAPLTVDPVVFEQYEESREARDERRRRPSSVALGAGPDVQWSVGAGDIVKQAISRRDHLRAALIDDSEK